jgi:SAM-dependent methyltransferase
MSAAAFDHLASRYDELWTHAPVGRLQRLAVWRQAASRFRPGDRILDLGCGTGEDAAYLGAAGMSVTAIDISPEMVRIARMRGIHAEVLAMEEIDSSAARFDGALSNFGALNCVRDLDFVSRKLGNLIRPGGYALLCFMGSFCLWETAWYLIRVQRRRAWRRWRGEDGSASLGLTIFYPTVARMRRAFAPQFDLVGIAGIGVCVPPSYVRGLPLPLLRLADRIDRAIATLPLIRSLSDHRLLIFRRR